MAYSVFTVTIANGIVYKKVGTAAAEVGVGGWGLQGEPRTMGDCMVNLRL